MALVRIWFAEHPPNVWTQFLEVSVRILNWILLALGLAVAAWSIITVVQIQHEPGSTPRPPTATPTPPTVPLGGPMALHGPPLGAPFAALQLQGSLKNVPWFIYAFGALGAATTLTSATALLGIRLRSPGCMSSHIFFMCLLLTGQACAAVAFFMDKGWQKRLPEIDEKLKEFLAARLQVCKWLGVGLLLLQLLALLLGCGLQGVYVGAEEAAEDADEEAAWRRRPLLARQAASPTRPAAATAATAGSSGGDDPEWRARMQQQYGLDTSQFSYQPGRAGRQAGDGSSSSRGAQTGGRSCSIM